MRLMPSVAAALPLIVLLSSCVGPGQDASDKRPQPGPESQRPTAPRPTSPPRPTDTASSDQPAGWSYRPATPGSWTYHADTVETLAMFGPSAAMPLLTLRCHRAAGRVSLIRAGAGSNTAQATMTIRTTYGAQNWPATTSATPPQTLAVRTASDTALDQIAYSRGKIAVEVPGLAPLIVPAWAEVSRVIEDCRG